MTKISLLCCISALSLGLTACNSKQQDPKIGEYGQVKIAYHLLNEQEIKAINQSAMPKPDVNHRPRADITYQLDAQKNPYRFVIVAKGTAIQDGKVSMRWLGGTQREDAPGYSPEIYKNPDVKYKANEPVTLVISSDPFSANAKDKNSYKHSYMSIIELTGRENFKVSSVELQIWQGRGTVYSWINYLKFLAIFLILFTLAYRAYSLLTRER